MDKLGVRKNTYKTAFLAQKHGNPPISLFFTNASDTIPPMMRRKKKLKILITAGGTREYLDPVRFLSNASSGKMGYALARAALRAGHKVTLITAPTALRPPAGARVIPAVTSDQMFMATRTEFPRCDCLIMAAAVSDYKPARASATKLKKTGDPLTLRLKPTRDILAWAGRHKKKHQTLVGFALEDRRIKTSAEQKMNAKHLDLIVANAPAAIAADKSTIHLKTPSAPWQTWHHVSKNKAAAQIIKKVAAL